MNDPYNTAVNEHKIPPWTVEDAGPYTAFVRNKKREARASLFCFTSYTRLSTLTISPTYIRW